MMALGESSTSARALGPAASALARTALDLAMERYADGDERAFTELFHALAPRVHAFLKRLSGSDDTASDLTQETFLRMHRARGTFARGHAVLPWAYAIARNCFTSHVRSPKYRAARGAVDVADHEVSAGTDASAEEKLAARQSAQIVGETLAGMSLINREAFVLLRFEGLSVAEAAEVIGATQSAVKVRAFRAYEALRAALDTGERRKGEPAAERQARVRGA
jgi:RNA polymerase sigma-70 factor (ECF subfamily)